MCVEIVFVRFGCCERIDVVGVIVIGVVKGFFGVWVLGVVKGFEVVEGDFFMVFVEELVFFFIVMMFVS